MNSPVHRGAFAHRIGRTLTFRAWRIPASGNAIPLDIGEPDTLADALTEAKLGTCLQHKEALYVHERDDARRTGTLHTFAVIKKGATWRRNPQTGVSERFEELDLKPLHSVAIRDFAPDTPFDAFRDDAVGVGRAIALSKEDYHG